MAPPSARGLAGALRDDSVWSAALYARRGVTLYLPPGHDRTRPVPVVYVADRENVRDYATVVDAAIAAGTLPPVALVGVWVSTGAPGGGPPQGPATDLRMIEYHPGVEQLPGADSAFIVARYRGHYRFFTDEVRQWAESALGVSRERRGRAVQGNSSGASYALRLGRELPDRYGLVIANSNVGADALRGPTAGWDAAPSHYLSAGSLEVPKMLRELRAVGDSLSVHRVPVVVNVYPGGHDALVWGTSTLAAVPTSRMGCGTTTARHSPLAVPAS